VSTRILQHAVALGRRPATLAAAALLALAGALAGTLPLLDVPGYELGTLGALAAVVAGGPLGIAAARRERAGERPSILAASAGAALVLGALLGVLFAASALRASIGPCRVLGQASFYPLLALPSAILASALAVAAGFIARGRRLGAALLYLVAVLGSLAATLATVYAGPAAFALDHLLGYWPGPLYDEAVRVDSRLLLFRVETIAAAAAVIAIGEAVLRARRGGLRPATAAIAIALVAAGAANGARAVRAGLGLHGDREAIAEALGARRVGPRCTVFLPDDRTAAAADALLAECEFHAADVARSLAIAQPPRVTVYVYRSAAEKKRLVGAAGTEYTKPWLAEIHLSDAALPHPILRHEIVHAVASALAPGPLGVPARAGVIVSPVLIEGLAVAFDVPRGPWTVHEWSRAARDLGQLPDLAHLLGPGGFFSAAPARAYTAAGSFLRFLVDRHGAAPVARAYGTGELENALGRPLPELVAEWTRFLDGVEVPPELASAAKARFERRGLFGQRCAREVALLEADAASAVAAGRGTEACALLERAAKLSGSPATLRAAADALARSGDAAAADEAYGAAAEAAGDDAGLQASVASARGDLAWRRGQPLVALGWYERALALRPDRAETRSLQAKILALSDAELSSAAQGWLLGTGDSSAALVRLARSQHPLSSYLLGRTLAARGDARAALPELTRAVAAPLPEGLALEARFLLAEARCAAGELDAGTGAFAELVRTAPREADRERAGAGSRRCAFERERRAPGAPAGAAAGRARQ
jgi:tetratricopeptide (TPR) repeat protein